MGRIYTVNFEKIAVSAVQDLISILGVTGAFFEILNFNIDCVDATAPTDQQLALRCRLLPATVTAGTSGAAATPQKESPGDAAATFTARVNDTGKATTSGTAVTRWEGGCNVKGGIEKHFVTKPTVLPGQQFVIELITTPASTLTLSGSCTVLEKG